MEINDSTSVLITGASSGIGATLAIALAQFGAKVAIAARRQDRLESVAAQIRAAGGTPLMIQADCSQKVDCERAVQTTIDTFGGIDILVNNVGRGNVASIEDTTPEQLESLFSLNVYSLWYTTAVALPVMKKQQRGHIINVSSMAGKSAFPGSSVYIATKHACVGFTAALRSELIDTGVEATVICPVNVKTEWASSTEGGSVEDLFAVALESLAKTDHPTALPEGIDPTLVTAIQDMGVMLSPEAVADTIIKTIQNPTQADVFTHPGSEQVARAIAHDRRTVETLQHDFLVAMRQAYETLHKS